MISIGGGEFAKNERFLASKAARRTGGRDTGNADPCNGRHGPERCKLPAMTEVIVKLPDKLANEAKAAGLLDAPALEQVFREALRRKAAGELLRALDEIEAAKLPPMTEAEIQAEIEAARADRRARETK